MIHELMSSPINQVTPNRRLEDKFLEEANWTTAAGINAHATIEANS